MVPLEKACDFSVSPDRTWYCHTDNADCESFEKSSEFSVLGTTNDMYGVADVLASCSVDMMKKTGKVFKETHFQQKAFEIDYKNIVGNKSLYI